ncbi:MAG: HEAT repeat domain-containing protein [Candidatus Hodarchaeales archaeon]
MSEEEKAVTGEEEKEEEEEKIIEEVEKPEEPDTGQLNEQTTVEEEEEIWGSAGEEEIEDGEWDPLGHKELKGKEKVEVMVGYLKSPELIVRSSAVNELISMYEEGDHKPDIIKGLLKSLDEDYWSAKFGAAEALGEIGDQWAIPALMKKLDDEDPEFRGQIALALGKMKASKAVIPITNLLKDENDVAREFAARALGMIKDKRAVKTLIWAMRDSVPEVRVAIAEAMGKIGDFEATDRLIRALNDKNEQVRKMVAWSLGGISNPRGIVPMVKILDDGFTTPEVREQLKESIASFDRDLVLQQANTIADGDQNEIVEILEQLLYHVHYPELEPDKEQIKGPLTIKYQRMLRRQTSEVKAVTAFVRGSFARMGDLRNIKELESIETSIPRNRRILEKVDLSALRKYKWITKDLFFDLKKTEDAMSEGNLAMGELETAIENKKKQLTGKK